MHCFPLSVSENNAVSSVAVTQMERGWRMVCVGEKPLCSFWSPDRDSDNDKDRHGSRRRRRRSKSDEREHERESKRARRSRSVSRSCRST